MAIFGTKKKTTKPTPSKKAEKVVKSENVSGAILLKPRITEKAAHMTAIDAYTFDISPRATKEDVAKAIQAVYSVKPKKIAIVKTMGKKVRLRNRRGFGARSASKKAYVYLKKGDRIEFAS